MVRGVRFSGARPAQAWVGSRARRGESCQISQRHLARLPHLRKCLPDHRLRCVDRAKGGESCQMARLRALPPIYSSV
jgi:hypothetical protein